MNANEIRSWNWYRGNLLWLPHRTIYLTRHGSHAYGTNIEGSDEDFKGIAIAPIEYYLGNAKSFEQADKAFGVQELDIVVYDIKKFFKLATDCNPSVIEVLFTDPSDWIIPNGPGCGALEEAFDQIYVNRELFLSRKARHTFSGYAMSQLKRILTHRRWLLNPPKEKPERTKYGLPQTSTIEKEQMGVINARIRKREDTMAGNGITKDRVEDEQVMLNLVEETVDELKIPKDLVKVIFNERRYNNAMREWDQYQTWKSERNEKRAALEARYGYDTKHAMHLVRLMRMAQEILTTGQVFVKRQDKDELLAIRDGAWSFDKLMDWAHDLDQSLDDAESASPLPYGPDREAIDEVLVRTITNFHP